MVAVSYMRLYIWNGFLRTVHILFTLFDMQRSSVRTV